MPAPAAGQSGAASGGQAESSQVSSEALASAPQAEAWPARKRSVKERLSAALSKAEPPGRLRKREYKQAETAFPAFCRRWERLLHERELNNLGHIEWRPRAGYQTGFYTGYSGIKSCACKRSAAGFAIGKLTYQEMKYYVVGRTPEEARRVKPTVVELTPTTELFRWDHGKWFY